MQQTGNNNSIRNCCSIYSGRRDSNCVRHNKTTLMQQPYHGSDDPSTHSSSPEAPRQFHPLNGVVCNLSSPSADHDSTPAVSFSFADSDELKYCYKDNVTKNDPAHEYGPLSNTKKEVSHKSNMCSHIKKGGHVDDSFTTSDKSWRKFSQVPNVEDGNGKKKERQMNSNSGDDKLMVNTNNSSLSNKLSSHINVISNNANRSIFKEKNEPAPSKLVSLNDVSSLESIKEVFDTSNFKDDNSILNFDFSGASDLMNCASSPESLLFVPQDKWLTKRRREGQDARETDRQAGHDEEIREALPTSTLNVADVFMKDNDKAKYRPNKKRRNSGEKFSIDTSNEHCYNKTPSYIFSFELDPSYPKDGNKNSVFPALSTMPSSVSLSSLIPLESLLTQPEKANVGQSNQYEDDANISSSMPPLEITSQDSSGRALIIESAECSVESGDTLISSSSFNNIFPRNNTGPQGPQGNLFSYRRSQYPNIPALVPDDKKINASSHHSYDQLPSQYYYCSRQQPNSSAPTMESYNHLFDEMRNQLFYGDFHNHGMTGISRSERMDMNYSRAPPRHIDEDGKSHNQCIIAPPAPRPRSSSQGHFSHHAPSWGSSSSTYGYHPQTSLSYNSDQPEPLQHLDQPHQPGPIGSAGHPSGPVSASHAPNVSHVPYYASHSGSFGAPNSSPQEVPPALGSKHREVYDGHKIMRNYSQYTSRSTSPRQHCHAHHLPSHPHLPHAFWPPRPEFTGHPHLNRRPPPTVYLLSSPPGGRAGIHDSRPYDPMVIGKGPGGVYIWSKEDDTRLLDIIKKNKNPKKWECIAKEFCRDKTSKECYERWIRYLKPGMRNGQWQDHEDAIVLKAVTASIEQPFTRWSHLTQRLPGRVGKQIRDRWVNHLNPIINHMPFSREDDLTLWDGYKTLGKSWVGISTKYFSSSRSENHIKNRWYSSYFKKFIANEFGPNKNEYQYSLGQVLSGPVKVKVKVTASRSA